LRSKDHTVTLTLHPLIRSLMRVQLPLLLSLGSLAMLHCYLRRSSVRGALHPRSVLPILLQPMQPRFRSKFSRFSKEKDYIDVEIVDDKNDKDDKKDGGLDRKWKEAEKSEGEETGGIFYSL
jgi:hypothetical protein